MAVDADGSPHAYSPRGSGLDALDYLANAGSPGGWYGLACDDAGEPAIQGMDDPAPGYYVSTTALQNHSKGLTDPRRYVDSEAIPYIAIPPELHHVGVKLGDLCVVQFGSKRCGAVVADVGPRGVFGEGSIALAIVLGIPASPKHGGAVHGVEYMVFPGTTAGFPMSAGDIQVDSQSLFEQWGGSERYIATFT